MSKTVLITGASSGIGYELAKIYANKNFNLVLVARNISKLNELKNVCQTNNNQVNIFSCDLSKSNAAKEVYLFCNSNHINIDYLINNAGFGDYGFFHECNWEKQAEMLHLNIITLTNLTRLFLPEMIQKKDGKIMNVASLAAFLPGPLMSVYYASKAYVLSFSEAISNELIGTGVSITTLCPGPTESGFWEAAEMNEISIIKGKKLPTSRDVAEYAYEQLEKRNVVAIHGSINKIMAFTIRLTPRSIVRKIVRIIQDKK
jgi:short-subunit dehydrogenase